MNLPKASTKNKDAQIKIESVKLFASYSNNETASNKKFNGKIIEVTGKVLKVISDKKGDTVVILDSGDPVAGVLCTLASKPSTQPKVGSTVTIKGQCSGLLMDVVLNKCHLIK